MDKIEADYKECKTWAWDVYRLSDVYSTRERLSNFTHCHETYRKAVAALKTDSKETQNTVKNVKKS